MAKKKLIPLVSKHFSYYRGGKSDKSIVNDDLTLDYDRVESDIISHNQFIRGVLKIPTVDNREIEFIPKDKIYFIKDNKEIGERDRTADEMNDSVVYGLFEYTKSLGGIELFFFNRDVGLDNYSRTKLREIISDLINNELVKSKIKHINN